MSRDDEDRAKELKLLLDKCEHQPSAVTDEDRQRIVTLREMTKPAH